MRCTRIEREGESEKKRTHHVIFIVERFGGANVSGNIPLRSLARFEFALKHTQPHTNAHTHTHFKLRAHVYACVYLSTRFAGLSQFHALMGSNE